jgi:hypothetical protein
MRAAAALEEAKRTWHNIARTSYKRFVADQGKSNPDTNALRRCLDLDVQVDTILPSPKPLSVRLIGSPADVTQRPSHPRPWLHAKGANASYSGALADLPSGLRSLRKAWICSASWIA